MQIAIAWLWATPLIGTTVPSLAAAFVAFITVGFALGWIVAGQESGEF
jgi:hypothetical protein